MRSLRFWVVSTFAVAFVTANVRAQSAGSRYHFNPDNSAQGLHSIGSVGRTSIDYFGQFGVSNSSTLGGSQASGFNSLSPGRLSPTGGAGDFRGRSRYGALETRSNSMAVREEAFTLFPQLPRPNLDQVRLQLNPNLRDTGPFRSLGLKIEEPPVTLARLLLDHANPLLAKSNLSRITRSPVTFRSYSLSGPSLTAIEIPSSPPGEQPVKSGFWDEQSSIDALRTRAYASSDGAPPGGSAPSLSTYAARLQQKERDSYRLGLAYFRERNYIQARTAFEICRTLNEDNATYYAAGVIVANQMNDLNSAVSLLTSALHRCHSLEELRVAIVDDPTHDVKGFYGKTPNVFGNLLDQANNRANQARGYTAAPMQFLFGYLAWLNGEVSTAISAVTNAEAQIGDKARPEVRKFRDLLIGERSDARPATGGPRNSETSPPSDEP